jgi:hypothetical protein
MAADPSWRPVEDIETKQIASQLLLEKDLILTLYTLIQASAGRATINESVIADENKTCAYPIDTPASSRRNHCTDATMTDRFTVKYNPEDLLIVGGVAVQLYDLSITGIKQRRYAHNVSTLRNYLQKDTSDMDMVWWPRITDHRPENEMVVTINSPAIISLVTSFKDNLEEIFERGIDIIRYLVNNARPDITLESIAIVESELGISAGARKVLLYFNIDIQGRKLRLEMCDISIHDGASGQKEKNFVLKPMRDDPMYCSPAQIITLPILDNKYIYLPDIISIIKQQILAFQNLLDGNNEKCLINFKRIRYLQLMIFEYYHQKQNANIRKLFKMAVNGRNIQMGDLFQYINSRITHIVTSICSKHNGKNRSNLCQQIEQLHSMYQYQLTSYSTMHHSQKMQELQQIHQLQQQIQQIQHMQELQQHPQPQSQPQSQPQAQAQSQPQQPQSRQPQSRRSRQRQTDHKPLPISPPLSPEKPKKGGFRHKRTQKQRRRNYRSHKHR